MSDEEIAETIRRALAQRRGYADGRSWPLDRSLEEYGIAQDFIQAAEGEPGYPFSDLRPRARGEDPPDCEALDCAGRRIAIEVTELVDRAALETVVRGGSAHYAEWTCAKLLDAVAARLAKKDIGDRLLGGPYDQFVVIIYTAEWHLDRERVQPWIEGHRFVRPATIDRAYLSLDYDPRMRHYPLVRLLW